MPRFALVSPNRKHDSFRRKIQSLHFWDAFACYRWMVLIDFRVIFFLQYVEMETITAIFEFQNDFKSFAPSLPNLRENIKTPLCPTAAHLLGRLSDCVSFQGTTSQSIKRSRNECTGTKQITQIKRRGIITVQRPPLHCIFLIAGVACELIAWEDDGVQDININEDSWCVPGRLDTYKNPNAETNGFCSNLFSQKYWRYVKSEGKDP